MPPFLGNLIIIVILAVAIFFAVRSLRRSHKSGGCGDCSSCGCGCSSCGTPAPKKIVKKDKE